MSTNGTSPAEWTSSLSSTGTAKPDSHRDCSTVHALGPGPTAGTRASLRDHLFDNPHAPLDGANDGNKRLSYMASDESWEISLTEQKATGKRNKTREPTYTIYVTTPTDSLTLSRTRSQLVDLDANLQSQFSLPSPSPVGLLGADEASSPRKRRAPIFATLSRTLSPHRLKQGKPEEPQSIAGVLSDDEDTDAHLPTARVSYYLSDMAKDSTITSSEGWQKFFAPGPNDLQSHRVERRVRQMRSDPALKAARNTDPQGRARSFRMDSDADSIAAMVALSQQFIDSAPSTDDLDLTPTVQKPRRQEGHQAAVMKDKQKQELPPTPAATPPKTESSGFFEETETQDEHIHLPPRPATCEPTRHDQDVKPIEVPSSNDAAGGGVAATPRRIRKKVERKAEVTGFDILRVLGKGCAGKVMLVRHHTTTGLFAMKSIHKHHVLAHRELLHTLTEQSVLKRVAQDGDNPFVVRLWWSFHNKENLFLVLDFHPGGDLATQLARWGRLGRDRTRFYCAEIAEGLDGLHRAGVIYRDLKPENVLIAVDGHIVLTDFGLSKQFDRPSRSHGGQVAPSWMPPNGDAAPPSPPPWQDYGETTTTFCGTAEYLAPEVLLGEPYSYECDAWSYGTMLYEMLTGMTPFWSDDHTTMYRRVLHEELYFHEEDRSIDPDTKSILRGLLQKNPTFRMSDVRIKKHPYFSMIDWEFVRSKRYIAPFIPAVNPEDELDTSNFDDAFLSMPAEIADAAEDAPADEEDNCEDKKEPQAEFDEEGRDVFEGYSFQVQDDSVSLVETVEELNEAAESTAQSGAKAHPADVPETTTPSSIGPQPLARDEDAMSSSAQSTSTRMTHGDRDVSMGQSGHSTDPSTATSEVHPKEASAGQASPKCHPSEVPAPEASEVVKEEPEGEDDWDVVEQEDQVAQNGRLLNGRRGGISKGKTLFQRGVPDRYVLAVVDAVRPTPKRSASSQNNTKKNVDRSRLSSRSSSVDGSSGAESPNRSKKGMFRIPRNNSSSQIQSATNGSKTPIKMRLKMSRATNKSVSQAAYDNSSVSSSDRADTPSSDRTAGPATGH